MSNQKTRELYRGFQENANAWLCHCTLVSPILRVLLVLSWAIVNFHVFPVFRESLCLLVKREREGKDIILRKSSNYGSLLFLFRSLTRHLQSDEGGVNGLCLFSLILNCSSLFFSEVLTAKVIYGRLFDIFWLGMGLWSLLFTTDPIPQLSLID